MIMILIFVKLLRGDKKSDGEEGGDKKSDGEEGGDKKSDGEEGGDKKSDGEVVDQSPNISVKKKKNVFV
uniref:Uncharacterized protein n=1 Tax=Oncorhynchus tshawytscha TaxID=74940 RepID=A0AAZ3Q684_ONCTS